MKKLTDYMDKCGSCAKFSRLIKDGKVQERGRCVLRGKYTYQYERKTPSFSYGDISDKSQYQEV